MFIDTHAHLYLEQFSEDLPSIIENAKLANVHKIFLPDIDSSTTQSMNNICKTYPDILYPMIGLHPCSVKEEYKKELSHVEEQLGNGTYYGVGETGIDLHWDVTFKAQQIEAFEIQIQWAKKYDLPIIIHSREALDLTIELIAEHQDGSLTGVFHCFNGNLDQSNRIQDLGFYMGLGGVITYKKADMGEVVSNMKMQHILLETDAPYLSPVPHRGKRNESSYIPFIAKKVSEFKDQSETEVMEQTTINAKILFQKAFLESPAP